VFRLRHGAWFAAFRSGTGVGDFSLKDGAACEVCEMTMVRLFRVRPVCEVTSPCAGARGCATMAPQFSANRRPVCEMTNRRPISPLLPDRHPQGGLFILRGV